MTTNRIITYSLLAHINNNLSDKSIKDLSEIFIPLVKKAISNLYQNGVTKGIISDLKKEVDRLYSFDMPYPTLVKIVKRIASEANKNRDNVFDFYSDHAFMIKKYIFAEYEEFVLQQDAEIKFLENAYYNYLLGQGLDIKLQPSLFDFIDKNRICLSQFFSKKIVSHIDAQYLNQAKFINSIKDNHELYNILKRVYLGSIIATYLEIEYNEVKEQDAELLLDTNFIVSMLDLHSVEATHTCLKMVNLCRRLGYKLRVLNFTVEETKALLARTAEGLPNVRIFTQLDTDSIENACLRRKINKTDLQKIIRLLEDTLRKDFGVHIITDKNYLRDKARESELLKKLQARRVNPSGALHDAMAILYVQERRGKEVLHFNEANCWFVIDSRKEYVKFFRKEGKFSEIIRAEDLVNILWLSNPSVNIEEIAEIGLTHLVSVTINNSLPNPAVLRELDENIQKYAVDKIDPIDCVRLASSVATQTVVNMESIEVLNRAASQSPLDFVNQLKDCIEKLNVEDKVRLESSNMMIAGLKSDLEKQIKNKETQLTADYEQKIEKNNKTIQEKTRILDNVINDRLKVAEEAFEALIKIKKSCDRDISKYAYAGVRVVVYAYIIEMLFFLWMVSIFGWSKVAPYSITITLLSVLFPWAYFAFAKHEFTPRSIYKKWFENYSKKIYNERNFNIQDFKDMESNLGKLRIEHDQYTAKKQE